MIQVYAIAKDLVCKAHNANATVIFCLNKINQMTYLRLLTYLQLFLIHV